MLALEGIRIVETASVFAGPMAGRLLADWGADVIHIEHPIRGDIARGIKESSVGIAGMLGGKAIQSEINYEGENHNRNKRGMSLDLSQQRGQGILYKLLSEADVFLSNFRSRELKKFKLEYETLSQLNPGLIYASVTGYGRKGPDEDTPGYDFLTFWKIKTAGSGWWTTGLPSTQCQNCARCSGIFPARPFRRNCWRT